jgi:hypothetical protein
MLFGATAFLGFLFGKSESAAPGVQDSQRTAAIAAVNRLFTGFMEKFRETECKALTGCDFSDKDAVERYRKEEVYKDTCLPQFEYVLDYCLKFVKDGKAL